MEPGLALICFKYYAFTQDFIEEKDLFPSQMNLESRYSRSLRDSLLMPLARLDWDGRFAR